MLRLPSFAIALLLQLALLAASPNHAWADRLPSPKSASQKPKPTKPKPKPKPSKPKPTFNPASTGSSNPFSNSTGPAIGSGGSTGGTTIATGGSPSVPSSGSVATIADAPLRRGTLGFPNTNTNGLPAGAQVLQLWVLDKQLSATAPNGVVRVVLQQSIGKGWKPIEARYLNGTAQTVTFTISDSIKLNELRLIGYSKSRFSAQQMAAESDFTWSDSSTVGEVVARVDISNTATLNGGLAVGLGNLALASNTTTNLTASTTTTALTTTPAAVESDIWKIIGNRLFFFNQYRGLQVFDLTDPAHPRKLGSLRMAAKGEFFYALDDTGSRLALLTRNDAKESAENLSSIRVLSISDAGVPSLIATVPVSGYLGESRLIGSHLYVVETYWQPEDGGNRWNYWQRFRIHGFDLSNPAAPTDLGSAEGEGYTPVLQAAGDYLLAATSSYQWLEDRYDYFSKVHAINISGDGKPRLAKIVTPKGSVRDQFKMSVLGDSLVTVTLKQGWSTGWHWTNTNNPDGSITTRYGWTYTPNQTWIESFALDDASTEAVAQVHLDAAQGESLHATRFDGSRLYVVTFGTRIDGPQTFEYSWTWTPGPRGYDPLFIIDLADPRHPVVHGQLEIPGWSNFLFPNGDRLFAVGRDGNHVAFSYYDVSDADAPKEISRIFAGDNEHYAWSEADWEHRAVTFLPEAGKAFIPFQQWDVGGYQSAMQVVNVARDAATLGPVIKQTGTARRGTAINGHLISISGRQLVVATDPPDGNSKEVAWVELSWPVDRVLASGDYLLQIEDGTRYGWWGYSTLANEEPIVRLSSRADPDTVLDTVSLGKGQVVGVEQSGGMFYIAQGVVIEEPAPAAITTSTTLIPEASNGIQITQAKAVNRAATKTIAVGRLSLFWGGWYNPQPFYTHLRTWSLGVKDAKLVQAGSTASRLNPTIDTVNTTVGTPNISNIQAAWVASNTLVWHVPFNSSYYYYPIYFDVSGNNSGISNSSTEATTTPPVVCALECPVTLGTDGVATASTSVTVTMPGNGSLYEVGKPIASNGFLFFSSKRGGNYYYNYPIAYMTNATTELSRPVSNTRMLNYGEFACSLHVLDFTAPATPVLRDPTPLPGMLLSAAAADAEGAWLITERQESHTHKDGSTTRVLQALAYDGIRAHRVDQLDSGEQNFSATAGIEGRVLCAVNRYDGYDNATSQYRYSSDVLLFRLNTTTGILEKLTPWTISPSGPNYDYISDLRIVGNHVLASNWGVLRIATLNSNDTFAPQVTASLPSTWWFNVTRAVLDGSGTGVWMPMGDYGVEFAELK